MVTPRPPFMNSIFIYFSAHFLSEKRDDFEGCFQGVDGYFKGVWISFSLLSKFKK